MSTLAADTIREGAIIWFKDLMDERSAWDCPAVITDVDDSRRYFRLRPLDGTTIPHRRFHFTCGPNESDARKSMRLAKPEEVAVYLQNRRRAVSSGTNEERQTFEDGLKLLPKELQELLAA